MTDKKTLSPVEPERIRARLRLDPLTSWMQYSLDEIGPAGVRASMIVQPQFIAPNGFLHASILTAFADITCGVGTSVILAEETPRFSTLEIKTNFMHTARSGKIFCLAVPRHIGSRTQVWDAEVSVAESGKTMALFRCTQMTASA